MKRTFNELWKTKEGSKTVYKIQAEKGILTFNTKKQALKWQELINKNRKEVKRK